MATFTNQTQLVYNDTVINSNIAVGEITEALTVAKSSLTGTYTPGSDITYVISLINTGSSAITGITLTDDLGAYDYNGTTLYPLTYNEGSAAAFLNGIQQPSPTVTATATSIVISGISVPAGGNIIIIYEATPNSYAPVQADGSITNTVTATSPDITAPVSADTTVTVASAPELSVIKSVEPVPVSENGTLTYTITVQNAGNEEVAATDNAVIRDTLDPAITGLTATLDGTLLVENTGYTYDETTGEFATLAGALSVPAATYVQNPDGTWTVTPGVTTLVITGTV